uniref:Uncharacterized protein n=1 Tax=Arundo donax TaxID=35708 RepID=A0A0A9F8A0_ARUDO
MSPTCQRYNSQFANMLCITLILHCQFIIITIRFVTRLAVQEINTLTQLQHSL